MCTTHPSSMSSSMCNDTKDQHENEDSSFYFDNPSDKEKEENFFKESDSESPDNIIEKSNDGHFGKFDEVLGLGTYKKLFKGYDFDAGREIAWNEIYIEQSDNKISTPYVVNLMNDIIKFEHPNLYNYLSCWYDNDKGRVVIITELLQGGNLKEYRKLIKRPKIKLIKKWIKQILQALNYLHEHKFIHHDLKCENILIDRITGNIKIADLSGSEKLDEKQGFFYKVKGTIEFMAPEVKEGHYTFKSDVYSLGMTIIQLLTLEKPYKEINNEQKIFEAKKKGEFPANMSQIENKEIVNFISLCLKKENERPNCKELLKNKWLNDNDSSDNHCYVNIINSLRQQKFYLEKINNSKDKKSKGSFSNNKLKENIFSLSNSSSSFVKKNKKSSSSNYSLDIPKLGKIKSKNNIDKNTQKMNSFRIKMDNSHIDLNKDKYVLSFCNLNENNSVILSERNNNKKDNSFFCNHITDLNENRLNSYFDNNKKLYIYISKGQKNLTCFFREKEEPQNENFLLEVKLVVPFKKFKLQQKMDDKFQLSLDEKKLNIEEIMEFLDGKILKIEKKEKSNISIKLKEEINKIIKQKMLFDLEDKINDIVTNFEFLINNEEFDDLECLINSNNFNIKKFTEDIQNKIKIYNKKKILLEKLFEQRNNMFEDYSMLKMQKIVITIDENIDNNNL